MRRVISFESNVFQKEINGFLHINLRRAGMLAFESPSPSSLCT
jgi:hypothetical protein